MQIKDLVEKAKRDEAVYISDVEGVFNAMDEVTPIYVTIDMIGAEQEKQFSFNLPASFPDEVFLEDFFFGKLYNIITTLGGRRLTVYYDTQNQQFSKMVTKLAVV